MTTIRLACAALIATGMTTFSTDAHAWVTPQQGMHAITNSPGSPATIPCYTGASQQGICGPDGCYVPGNSTAPGTLPMIEPWQVGTPANWGSPTAPGQFGNSWGPTNPRNDGLGMPAMPPARERVRRPVTPQRYPYDLPDAENRPQNEHSRPRPLPDGNSSFPPGMFLQVENSLQTLPSWRNDGSALH